MCFFAQPQLLSRSPTRSVEKEGSYLAQVTLIAHIFSGSHMSGTCSALRCSHIAALTLARQLIHHYFFHSINEDFWFCGR